MTEQPVLIGDSDDGRDLLDTMVGLLGMPNSDEVFVAALLRLKGYFAGDKLDRDLSNATPDINQITAFRSVIRVDLDERRIAVLEALTSEIAPNERPIWRPATDANVGAVTYTVYNDRVTPSQDDVVAMNYAVSQTVNTDDNVRLYLRVATGRAKSSTRVWVDYRTISDVALSNSHFVLKFTAGRFDYYAWEIDAGSGPLPYESFNRGAVLQVQLAATERHNSWTGEILNSSMAAAIGGTDGQVVVIRGGQLAPEDADNEDAQARQGVVSNQAAIETLRTDKLDASAAFTQADADGRYVQQSEYPTLPVYGHVAFHPAGVSGRTFPSTLGVAAAIKQTRKQVADISINLSGFTKSLFWSDEAGGYDEASFLDVEINTIHNNLAADAKSMHLRLIYRFNDDSVQTDDYYYPVNASAFA